MQPVRKSDVFQVFNVQASIRKMNVANVVVPKEEYLEMRKSLFKAKLCNHLYCEVLAFVWAVKPEHCGCGSTVIGT